MTATTATKSPPIFCSAEWHLRDNPRAAAIYSLALRLTKGGKKMFFLSQRQLAAYFGWCLDSTNAAFKTLARSGLFLLVAKGSGGDPHRQNLASRYQVLTHAQLARKTGHDCYVKPARTVLENRTPLSYKTEHERSEKQNLIYEVVSEESTNKQETKGANERALCGLDFLPAWIPRENWNYWVESRRGMGKPITRNEAQKMVKQLNDYRHEGQDLDLVLEHCIAGGYHDLIEAPASSI